MRVGADTTKSVDTLNVGNHDGDRRKLDKRIDEHWQRADEDFLGQVHLALYGRTG